MFSRAVYHKYLSGLLSVMLVLTCIQAENLDVSVVTSQEKSLRLAERMESYGYFKSALHYYKLVQLEPNLSKEERKRINLKIEMIQSKFSKKNPVVTLPDLDEMLHVNTVATAVTEKVSRERPESFPKTRINKKKWFIGSLIVIGVGVIAYTVNKNLRKKSSSTSTIEIGF